MDKYLFTVIVTHFHNFDNQKKHISKIIIGAPRCFLIDIFFFFFFNLRGALLCLLMKLMQPKGGCF